MEFSASGHVAWARDWSNMRQVQPVGNEGNCMAAILTNLRNTVITGFVLAIVVLLILRGGLGGMDQAFWAFIFRWLHVLSGVMWIGLLWYFNFVQIPNMAKIPDEQKPAIGKV